MQISPIPICVFKILIIFVLYVSPSSGLGCSAVDRAALLGFKARIVKDTTEIMASWVGKDCCDGSWTGCIVDGVRRALIPVQFGQLSNLTVLIFQITGFVSVRYCVPKWITSRELSDVNLAGCNLKGFLPIFTRPGSLSSIDLSDNHFTGGLSGLTKLDVSRNRLTGTIPPSLGNLPKLGWLDVSINSIGGKIPTSLLVIRYLRHANFRANKLCGEIPQGRPLNIFPSSAYAHNLCLCGKPLPPCKQAPAT
ncbi:probable leucine-rich repeat receptor-like protein kinase [Tanacetum coccineum]